MSELAVRAKGIGKRYRIGELEKRLQHGSLRETLTSAMAAPRPAPRKPATSNPATTAGAAMTSVTVARCFIAAIQ